MLPLEFANVGASEGAISRAGVRVVAQEARSTAETNANSRFRNPLKCEVKGAVCRMEARWGRLKQSSNIWQGRCRYV